MTVILKHETFDLESLQVYPDGILRTSHGQTIDFEPKQVLCDWCCEPLEDEQEIYQKAHEVCRLHAEKL